MTWALNNYLLPIEGELTINNENIVIVDKLNHILKNDCLNFVPVMYCEKTVSIEDTCNGILSLKDTLYSS